MASEGIQKDEGDAYLNKTPPTAAYISWFLAQSDVQSPNSPLHRLGPTAENAAPGNHRHDGRSSAFLFNSSSDIITGNIGTTAGQREAMKKLLTILRRYGLTDNTTG